MMIGREVKQLHDEEMGDLTDTPPDASDETTLDQIDQMNPMASESTFELEIQKGLKKLSKSGNSYTVGTSSRRRKKGMGNGTEKTMTSIGSLNISDMESDPLYEHEDDDSATSRNTRKTKWLLTFLIATLGIAASAAFIAFGVHATNNDMESRFTSTAEGITHRILASWETYETFGLWIHESCHKHVRPNRNIDPYDDIAAHLGFCSRQEFRRLFEYMSTQGVDFLAAQLLRNISHDVRDALEAQAKEYYDTEYPYVNYAGISEQVMLEDGGFYLQKKGQAEYYLPVHYVEPVAGNEVVIELDKFGAPSGQVAIRAIETQKPILSSRLTLVQEKNNAYGVILAHPGLRTVFERREGVVRTNSVAQIVIRVPSFLKYALKSDSRNEHVYLYDSTNGTEPENMEYLGALEVNVAPGTGNGAPKPVFTELPEINVMDIPRPSKSRYFQRELDVAGRKWTMVMVSSEHQADLLFVILGGSIIFVATMFFALWFHTHLDRVAKVHQIKSRAQAQKAEIARIQAMRERHLNEFIAHEVRNPLSSAISALSFVSVGVAEHVPNPVHKKGILEDVGIMDASLQFINELLRNMLDIHRARSKQIKLNLAPVDIRRDILEPVAAILFMRGAKVEIRIECPHDLIVKGDRMRLKQIMLNLSSNATKFVQRGYICLKASVVDSSVVLSVLDSGPGIPLEKRNRLFAKFQESLDSLNQGTGIGLAVCKNLCELMGADIWLDEDFTSDVEGLPGTCFMLRLNQPVLEMDHSFNNHHLLHPEEGDHLLHSEGEKSENEKPTMSAGEAAAASMMAQESKPNPSLVLPEKLSVLLVDDDTMIRKMFRRAALRVAPQWEIEEASNGETALVITGTRKFDVIFIDQYMASVEKQLLGTETARALRSRGVQSIICGLSANDMGVQFMESGADNFIMKPFPCKKDAMTRALHEVLTTGRVRKAIEGESAEFSS